MWIDARKLKLPSPAEALPGRDERMPVPDQHFVNGHRLTPPFPEGMEHALFGMGCFDWRMKQMTDGARNSTMNVAGTYRLSFEAGADIQKSTNRHSKVQHGAEVSPSSSSADPGIIEEVV